MNKITKDQMGIKSFKLSEVQVNVDKFHDEQVKSAIEANPLSKLK